MYNNVEENLYDNLPFQGANFLSCNKKISQHHFFLFFELSFSLPCKNTFMDDYDGI